MALLIFGCLAAVLFVLRVGMVSRVVGRGLEARQRGLFGCFFFFSGGGEGLGGGGGGAGGREGGAGEGRKAHSS